MAVEAAEHRTHGAGPKVQRVACEERRRDETWEARWGGCGGAPAAGGGQGSMSAYRRAAEELKNHENAHRVGLLARSCHVPLHTKKKGRGEEVDGRN